MASSNENPICEPQQVCVVKPTSDNAKKNIITIANTTQTKKYQNINNTGEHNFQLVRLLTTNPAAALPAIFTPSGKYEQRRAKTVRSTPVHTQQPRGFVQVPFNAGHNVIRTAQGQFYVSLPVQTEESYPYLYATEEEIEKKGSCCDELGCFDLQSILPIDCQIQWICI